MPLIRMDGEMMISTECDERALFTSPFGGEVGAQRRVRGAFLGLVRGEGRLTRPKTVDLSPQGEVALPRLREITE